MRINLARWITCTATCMSVGYSGLERHPSEKATAYAPPGSEDVTASLQSDAVSQSKAGMKQRDQEEPLRSQPVSQASYAHQPSHASGVVEPASVDVIMIDPVTSNEAMADGADARRTPDACVRKQPHHKRTRCYHASSCWISHPGWSARLAIALGEYLLTRTLNAVIINSADDTLRGLPLGQE